MEKINGITFDVNKFADDLKALLIKSFSQLEDNQFDNQSKNNQSKNNQVNKQQEKEVSIKTAPKKVLTKNLQNKQNDKTNSLMNKSNNLMNKSNNLMDIINLLKTDKNINADWWQKYRRTFQSGDIVYINSINKFGILVNPSNKINKVKVRLLKHNNKNDIYSNDWVFDVTDVELVKHNHRVSRKFSENDRMFKIK